MSDVAKLQERERRLARAQEVAKWAVAAAMVIGICIALVLIIVQGDRLTDIAQGNREINQSNRENTELLIDCTTPGGECFERSREGSSGAIQDINRVTVLAAYCANINTDLPALEACIQEGLEDQ